MEQTGIKKEPNNQSNNVNNAMTVAPSSKSQTRTTERDRGGVNPFFLYLRGIGLRAIMAQDDRQQSEDSKRIQPPAIAFPKGSGAIGGIEEKFAANHVIGTGSMTVPLATSSGRYGFCPQLSLAYDSGTGNGPFGFGWSLSIPAITRKTDKGIPQYRNAEESDIYSLYGAEDLVPVHQPDGTRFEDGKTAPGYRIHRHPPASKACSPELSAGPTSPPVRKASI